MAKKETVNKQDNMPRTGESKPRPDHYPTSNPRSLLDPQQHTNYIAKHWWRPAPGGYGLPTNPVARQARVDRFFAAMVDFSDVYDSDNVFTDGRVIEIDDIEATCLRIANAIDDLHNNGLCVPYVADPTTYQATVKGKKTWKLIQQERDLTAVQRENAVAEHLRHYKKACLDAVQHDKDLTILFVAAPHVAAKKRDSNAKSNGQRKRRVRDGDQIDPRPTKRTMTQTSTKMDSIIHQPEVKVEAEEDELNFLSMSVAAPYYEPQTRFLAPDIGDSAFDFSPASAGPWFNDIGMDFVLDDDFSFNPQEYDWLLQN